MREDLRNRLLLPLAIPLAGFLFMGVIVYSLAQVYLSVTKTGAVIIAMMVALGILLAAAFVAAMPRIRGVQLVSMLGVVAGIALISAGVVSATFTEEEEEEAAGGGEPGVLQVTAPPGASADGFDKTELTAPAGTPFVIEFQNDETGVPHNVEILSEGPATNPDAERLFAPPGDATITGVASARYEVPALDEGEYFFFCVVHPTTMTGTLRVEPGPPGGGGPASITAEGIAFSTNELRLPAGRQVTIHFENKDDGIPHNVAIYTEQGGEAIFQGEVITGPASRDYTFEAPEPGTYYFQCDVHPPQMNGTVVVA